MVEVPIDPIKIVEKISDYFKEKRFKQGRIHLVVDRYRTELERCEVIIEGTWDTWVNNPPGLFLKDVEMYDLVRPVEGYIVTESIPEYSKKIEHRNVQKKI